MILGKYSFGIGDRFGHQGKAQLAALMEAKDHGLNLTPVWNKSYREHSIVGTDPADVRREADEAVTASGWAGPYFVDADHVGLSNVDQFLEASDFFTLDVADFAGRKAEDSDVSAFVKKHEGLVGPLTIPATNATYEITEELVGTVAAKYLFAVKQAGKIYRHIEQAKGVDTFITEVSMDETDQPQTPVELLLILAAIADEKIPAQTIAPKFTGRFNKGVDYVGDVDGFAKEFEEDLAVVTFAIGEFGLPENLKLSIHSGSDKFSIYEPVNKALKNFDVGLHLKTAGTTWLEELIGLALAGGDGLVIAREIYAEALLRIDELCGPYATIIDIHAENLPSANEVAKWDGRTFAAALRHDSSCPAYNPDLRQLLHVAYKIAAEMGTRFTHALAEYEDIIAPNVTANLYDRHIRPLLG